MTDCLYSAAHGESRFFGFFLVYFIFIVYFCSQYENDEENTIADGHDGVGHDCQGAKSSDGRSLNHPSVTTTVGKTSVEGKDGQYRGHQPR